MSTYKDFMIVFFALLTGATICVLGGLPIKYTFPVALAAPFFLTLAVTQNKDRFFLAALTLALSFAAAKVVLGGLPATIHLGGAQTHPEIRIPDIIMVLFFIHLFVNQAPSWQKAAVSLPTGCTKSLGLFLLMSALSILPSEHRLLGIVSLLDLVKVSLVWLFFAKMIRDEKDINIVVKLLMMGLVIQSGFAIYQAKFGFPDWAYPIVQGGDPTKIQELTGGSFLRVGGLFGWPVTFAEYLELLIPMTLCLFVVASKWWETLIYGAITLLGLIALILTLCRGAWIALPLGGGVSVIALLRHSTSHIRKRLLLTLGLVAVILALLAPLIMDRLSSPDEEAAINRLPMWMVGLNVIKHNPILGTGLNSYTEIMHHYDPQGLIRDFTYPVHNVYLFIAAEVGLIGLFFLIFFYSAILVGLVRTLGNSSSRIAAISAGLLGGITAVLCQGMLDTCFKQDLQLWYVLMGLCGLAVSVCRIGRELPQAQMTS